MLQGQNRIALAYNKIISNKIKILFVLVSLFFTYMTIYKISEEKNAEIEKQLSDEIQEVFFGDQPASASTVQDLMFKIIVHRLYKQATLLW
jgi:hypothetical protein